MLREIIKLRTQKGSLMVEAMAMLALIAMVTPVIYKKAAERTSELQDINAASQMRSIINSIDRYMKDNYVTMKKGQTVNTACTGTDQNKSYSAFSGAGDKTVTVNLNHFCEYLPYGLDTKSKTFKDFTVAIKKEDTTSGRVLMTAVVIGQPTDPNLQMIRSSRIASMIGSNGGVVRDDAKPTEDSTNVQGTQGIWSLDLGDFGIAKQAAGTIVAASMQSVATSSVGSEDVLYRVDTGYPEMNTMSTDLFMANHDIEDVNTMVINGNNANAEAGNYALLVQGKPSEFQKDIFARANAIIKDGAFIGLTDKPASGDKLYVAGTTSLNGTTNINSGDLNVTTGNTTLGGTLDVTGNTSLGGNLDVTGTTTLTGELTANGGATVTNGLTADTATITRDFSSSNSGFTTTNSNGKTTVNITSGTTGSLGGNLNVTGDYTKGTGIVTAEAVDVKILESDIGKFEELYAGTDDNTNDQPNTYTLAVGTGFVRIKDNNFAVGNQIVDSSGNLTNPSISNPGTTHLAVMNTDTFMSNDNVAMLATKLATIKAGTSATIDTPDFRVKNGDTEYFRVKPASSTTENKGVQVTNTDFIVSENNNLTSKVFEVNPTTSLPSQKASVRVRKGVIEIATNEDTTQTDANATGYIQLDRIVDNRTWDASGLPSAGSETKYDRFQVNPAYTSVMHDIKLTTRGGARLSDILPDFINKGIYVLDNTYKENGCSGTTCNWESGNVFSSSGPGFTDSHISASSCATGDMTCVASPWLGYIPAPQCPPGYSKVVTLAPIRFNMAQAGLAYENTSLDRNGKYDVWMYKDPEEQAANLGNADERPFLTFQKSTWLNTSLKAHCVGKTNYDCGEDNNNAPDSSGFQGWSGIMGFIYGGMVYKDYFHDVYGKNPANDEFAWNLFPVYNQELTAIADVYCYFDRGKFTGSANEALIDTEYDQMYNFRGPTKDGDGSLYDKPDAYKNRLNDPKLKYADPW